MSNIDTQRLDLYSDIGIHNKICKITGKILLISDLLGPFSSSKVRFFFLATIVTF